MLQSSVCVVLALLSPSRTRPADAGAPVAAVCAAPCVSTDSERAVARRCRVGSILDADDDDNVGESGGDNARCGGGHALASLSAGELLCRCGDRAGIAPRSVVLCECANDQRVRAHVCVRVSAYVRGLAAKNALLACD
jgi:hypothetical protein